MRRVNRTQWAITVAVMAMANTAFVLLLHYSRFAPPAAGGIRYIPSTAVFLSEAAKLVLSLTCALYVIAQPAGPNLWVSTLLGTLAHQIFLSRDAWKMLLPATCYSAYNILLHIALSNLDAATFTITYQLQLVLFAALSYALLRRAVNHDRAVALGLLAFGVLLTQWYREGTDTELDEKRTETGPRSVAEFKRMGTALGGPLMAKRSATYEGMDQDLILAYPDMNRNIGAVATLGAAAASAVGGAVFERIVVAGGGTSIAGDDAVNTDSKSDGCVSVWVRNIQLSLISMVQIGFLGVGMYDAEQIEAQSFFGGYDWVVWTVVGLQACMGLAVSCCVVGGQRWTKESAARVSAFAIFFAGMYLFEFPEGNLNLAGSAIVLVSIVFYGPWTPNPHYPHRPTPLPLHNTHAHAHARHEKLDDERAAAKNSPALNAARQEDERYLRIPGTPELMGEKEGAGLSTSRPSSPAPTPRGHHHHHHHHHHQVNE